MQTPTIMMTITMIQNAMQMKTLMLTAMLWFKTQMRAGQQVWPISKRPKRSLKQGHRALAGAGSLQARSADKTLQGLIVSVGFPAILQANMRITKVYSHTTISSALLCASAGQASPCYSSLNSERAFPPQRVEKRKWSLPTVTFH